MPSGLRAFEFETTRIEGKIYLNTRETASSVIRETFDDDDKAFPSTIF